MKSNVFYSAVTAILDNLSQLMMILFKILSFLDG